jgi:hypothetical protein
MQISEYELNDALLYFSNFVNSDETNVISKIESILAKFACDILNEDQENKYFNILKNAYINYNEYDNVYGFKNNDMLSKLEERSNLF